MQLHQQIMQLTPIDVGQCDDFAATNDWEVDNEVAEMGKFACTKDSASAGTVLSKDFEYTNMYEYMLLYVY